jgi:hypothetical protein
MGSLWSFQDPRDGRLYRCETDSGDRAMVCLGCLSGEGVDFPGVGGENPWRQPSSDTQYNRGWASRYGGL